MSPFVATGASTIAVWLLIASSMTAAIESWHENGHASGHSHLAIAQRRLTAHPGRATVDISGDGRFIAFESQVGLVPKDTNDLQDVYVLDRTTGRVTLESVTAGGGAAGGTSSHPRLSGDGRFVVFESVADDLVAPRSPYAQTEVYLRDRVTGLMRRVSAAVDGRPGNRSSGAPDISADGRHVVFHSAATRHVYLFDVAAHTLTQVSVDTGLSRDPSVSADGRTIAFVSPAPSGGPAVFVRDLRAETMTLVSRGVSGGRPNGTSYSPAISADGRRVAFTSTATDLGPPDRNQASDVYVHDVSTGWTTIVSRNVRGEAANGASAYPAISGDGRFVAFTSEASDLLCDRRCPAERRDRNLVADVYVADTQTGTITRVSRGPRAGEEWWDASAGAALDASGSLVVFSSLHAGGEDDDAHDFDAFLRILPRLPAP